ncbi:MAG: phage protein Gp10 family [Anaerocolumna sp.]|jgi:HK97 gp10 family phage protein|nr:phage protein Gp10 family [Anaerocolumna sp.]
MSNEFEVQGLEGLMKKLEQMGRAGAKIEDKALQKAAEPVLNDIKSTTAFEDHSHKLRNSFKISKVKKKKEGKYVWVGDVDKEANYSWYVEYGSSKKAARPFLRPAFEKNKDEVLKILKQEIAKGLKGK